MKKYRERIKGIILSVSLATILVSCGRNDFVQNMQEAAAETSGEQEEVRLPEWEPALETAAEKTGIKAADLAVVQEEPVQKPEETVPEEPIQDTGQVSCIAVEEGYKLILRNREKEEVFLTIYPQEPEIEEIAEGIWEIGVDGDTKESYVFYFREEDSKISDAYYNSMRFEETFVGYMEDGTLILTDIFSEGELYAEVEADFAHTEKPIDAVIRIEKADWASIRVIYYSERNFTKETEFVKLRSDEENKAKQPLKTQEKEKIPEEYQGIYEIVGYDSGIYFNAVRYDFWPPQEADMMIGKYVEIGENQIVTYNTPRKNLKGLQWADRNFRLARICLDDSAYEWENLKLESGWYEEAVWSYVGAIESVLWEYHEEIQGKISLYWKEYEFQRLYIMEDCILMAPSGVDAVFYLKKVDKAPEEPEELSEEEKAKALRRAYGTYTIKEFLPTQYYQVPYFWGDNLLPQEEADMMIGKEIIIEYDGFRTYDNMRRGALETRYMTDNFWVQEVWIGNPDYQIAEMCRDDIFGLRDDILPEELVQDTYIVIDVNPGYRVKGNSTYSTRPEIYLLENGDAILYAMEEYFLMEKTEGDGTYVDFSEIEKEHEILEYNICAGEGIPGGSKGYLYEQRFPFDFNDDGIEDYILCRPDEENNAAGDSLGIYIRDEDGESECKLWIKIPFHGKRAHAPVTVLNEKDNGFYAIVLPDNHILRYGYIEGWDWEGYYYAS